MDKETYLNIADLKAIRLAIADKLVGRNFKGREIALLRVEKKIDEIIYSRTCNTEIKMKLDIHY